MPVLWAAKTLCSGLWNRRDYGSPAHDERTSSSRSPNYGLRSRRANNMAGSTFARDGQVGKAITRERRDRRI
jgi:hypothetical protein